MNDAKIRVLLPLVPEAAFADVSRLARASAGPNGVPAASILEKANATAMTH